jgi:hypothetical protein
MELGAVADNELFDTGGLHVESITRVMAVGSITKLSLKLVRISQVFGTNKIEDRQGTA